MKILFLSDFCPWPLDNGYRQRIYQLIQELSSRHDVTLATVMPDFMRGQPFPPASHCVELIPLSLEGCAFRRTKKFERWTSGWNRLVTLISSPYPNIVRRFHSAEILKELQKLHDRESFDVVWAERPYIAELARNVGFSRIVIDLPDIETQLLGRNLKNSRWYPSKPLHYLELAKLYVYEQLMPIRFWRLVPCKDEDRRFFRLWRSKVIVLPNGTEEHQPCPDVENSGAGPQLMFVGGLSYESNIDAIHFFVGSVLPSIRRQYPHVQFVMIGREPVPGILALDGRNGCRVLSDVPDLTPHFEAASLFVAPIRMGSGTRLKVLEAMMRQKAVVATPVAAEGLEIRPGIDLEVADAPEAFAAACCALLADTDRRRRLAASGRARVLERYLWSRLTEIAHLVLDERPDRAPRPVSTSEIPQRRETL